MVPIAPGKLMVPIFSKKVGSVGSTCHLTREIDPTPSRKFKLIYTRLVSGVEDVVYPGVAVATGVVIYQIRPTVALRCVAFEMVPVPANMKIPFTPLLLATLFR